MGETSEILRILTETAPLVLAVLVLAGVLLGFLYVSLRIFLPALSMAAKFFSDFQQSYEEMLEREDKMAKREIAALREDLQEETTARKKLEKEVAGLEAKLEERTKQLNEANRRIAELESKERKQAAQIEALEAQNTSKSLQIQQLEQDLVVIKRDRDRVADERDGLKEEVHGLRGEVQQLRQRLENTENGDAAKKPPIKKGDTEKPAEDKAA